MQRSLRATVLLLIGGLALTACGSGSTDKPAAGGKVTITVTGQPPKTQSVERKLFDQDVAEFEASHPDIHIEPHEGFMDPKTFSAKLAGGQLEDVYYVYFTDPATIIARRQAADITDQVKDLPVLKQLQQPLIDIFKDRNGRIYGLPTANYSMGLLYNRALFTKAGLDPDQPPATWDEVRADAKKIAALGGDTVGFADLSKNNQGGWHLVTWTYAMGSQVARQDGDKWVADFNNDKVKGALRLLHDMRWTDNTMGAKQLLEATDVQQMMGSGKLGMYLAAPDNVPVLVKQFNGRYEDYGVAAMPGGQGTLLGGEGYMVNPKASPDKIKAGLAWIQWKYLNPDRIETRIKQYLAEQQPIGLPAIPTPDIWTGDVKAKQNALKAQYANVPAKNFQSYLDGNGTLRGNLEPPNAQQIYAVLDGVMQAVLTNKDANVDQLLTDAEGKVNSALAQVK
ncbi:ABC transporter substrate-binding protein [Actinocrispum wychmicini]|uniref:ABC-type glycerol-3-phosphate transport system substrate-binding protein n=1 Tax=Actinocrispum wychmicini TaxID=1213861 RepID=A0A4R2IVA2_9PSEU|nr:extracellular solute-binding protein [Actinocrispum wychmicini]TCO48078.1 ABC-type glycerol-3-phosphate transport system substrate-binding protein [Actinocrispum wychmicini]